jgi:hypothetical protein
MTDPTDADGPRPGPVPTSGMSPYAGGGVAHRIATIYAAHLLLATGRPETSDRPIVQVRRWTSWRRWTLIAMLAHALLVVLATTELARDPAPAGPSR